MASTNFVAPNDPILLTPVNLPDVMNEIYHLHDDQILIAEKFIKKFLKQSLTGSYQKPLAPIVPSVNNMTENKIEFLWNAIPDAKEYIVRYLSLTNSSEGVKTTTLTGVKLLLTNDFYLITFQTKDKYGKFSKTRVLPHSKETKFIIIEDKPLSFSLNEDCECLDHVTEPQEFLVDNSQSLITPFAELPGSSLYHVRVLSEENGLPEESNYYVNFTRTLDYLMEVGVYYDNTTTLSYGPPCITNMDLMGIELSHVFALNSTFTFDDERIRAVRFGFVDGLTAKSLNPLTNATVVVSQCVLYNEPPGAFRHNTNSSNLAEVKIIPNPSTGKIVFDYSTPDNIPNSIQILNNYGQVVKEVPAFQVRVKADIEDLASGMYYVRSISDKGIKTSSFIKN